MPFSTVIIDNSRKVVRVSVCPGRIGNAAKSSLSGILEKGQGNFVVARTGLTEMPQFDKTRIGAMQIFGG